MSSRIAVFSLWLLHFLPFIAQVAIGNLLGSMLYVLARERRKVATINLRLCFPEMDAVTRRRLVRKNFQAFARSFIERGILWWSSAKRIEGLIKVVDAECYQALQGKPIIFLVPHFVGLDVAATWSCMHMNGVTMYSNQKDPYLNKVLREKRLRFGQQQLYARQQGLRPIIKELQKGLPFFYLPDQDLDVRDGAFIPFFGVPAATLTALPRLAAITGAHIVPLIVRLLPGSTGYELKYYPAWVNYPSGDIIADTCRMNAFIEERIREMPEQYFWLHKRFKTRPEGEDKLY